MKKIIFSVVLSLPIYVKSQDNFIQHTVLPGETLYQISRNYSVSVQSIYKLNPDINPNIIAPNQIILVPREEITSVTTTQNGDTITHIVNAGETKFGLSKKYGVSIAELENQNPHIKPMLQVGHKLQIKTQLTTTYQANNATTHTVVAGETLYAISRKYNTTLDDLVKNNKIDLNEILRIGQTLIIPTDKNDVSHLKGQNINATYHIVQPGETKFGLSKQYNISIARLEELNPHIVNVLRAGDEIKIGESEVTIIKNTSDIVTEEPAKESVKDTVTQETPTTENQTSTEKKYITYIIQPKETLYSLSRKANLTHEEMLALNPELQDGVKAGMQIKMPDFVVQTWVTTTEKSLSELEKSMVKNQTKNIAFLFPFNYKEYENYKHGLNTSGYKNEFEFYRGALLAMDSIKKLGIKVNHTLYHSDSEISNLNESLQNNKTDIIFGNQKSSSLSRTSDIPFVYTTEVYDTDSQGNHIKPFATNSEKLIHLLGYLNSKNANIIVISDIEKTQDKEIISNLTPDAKFALLSDKANPDTANLKSLMSKTQKNIVLLNTSQNGLFLNTTNYLLSEISEFDIQLAVVQDIPNDIASMRLRVLKTIYASNQYNLHQKLNKNLSIASERGFDLTYDMLVRLYQEQELELILLNHTTKQIYHQFSYQKDQQNNYHNNNIHIYYYDTDTDAKLAQ